MILITDRSHSPRVVTVARSYLDAVTRYAMAPKFIADLDKQRITQSQNRHFRAGVIRRANSRP